MCVAREVFWNSSSEDGTRVNTTQTYIGTEVLNDGTQFVGTQK